MDQQQKPEDPQVTIQRLVGEINRLQEQVASMQSIIVHQAAKELDEARKLTQMTGLARSLEGDRDRVLRDLSIARGEAEELRAQLVPPAPESPKAALPDAPEPVEVERVLEPA